MENKTKITVSEAESILAANGLRTNINKGFPSPAYHGGQQMRVVRTARGTYAAVVTEFEREYFHVVKIDAEDRVTLLYCGEYMSDNSEVLLNIGQDVTGDVVVVACGPETLNAYIFDRDTDEVTQYTERGAFFCSGGYSAVLFDFARRRICAFYESDVRTGDFILSWFLFDLEKKQWSAPAFVKKMEGIRRHCYLYPFPDGCGGAYFVAERDDTVKLEEKLRDTGEHKYLWDELRLFHIPDLTSTENVTYTAIHEAYSERGAEGIWSSITNNQCGGVFMDADGYLHVTYLYCLYDLSGKHPDLDQDYHYRHAVYRGMECVFNERIPFAGEGGTGCRPLVTQAADGTLYMIVCTQWAREGAAPIGIYRAQDTLGREWKPEATVRIPEGLLVKSFSISEARNGSVQDDVLSCFFYGNDERNVRCTAYAFTLSLKDHTVTPAADLLKEYDLVTEPRHDRRAYNSAHTTKIVHTEKGAYAAFTYNYVFGPRTYDTWDYENKKEEYHVVRIGGEGTKVLYSGSYVSRQNRYLTMRRTDGGKIVVCPPDGDTAITVDPESGTVRERIAAGGASAVRQQTDIIAANGTEYALCCMNTNPFTLTGYRICADGMPFGVPKAYVFDRTIPDVYTGLYTLSDGKAGAYLVGTRVIGRPVITDRKRRYEADGSFRLAVTREARYTSPLPAALTYSGYTKTIADSLMLFYIPDLAGDAVRCVELEPPYEAEGARGVWSVVDAADRGDAYLDADGKLHVFYTAYHFGFNDAERPGNPALVARTLKHMHAIYDGATLVSSGELGIAGLTKDSSVRMAQTADGTKYLLVCDLQQAGAQIDVYAETADGWALTASQPLGSFTAESFSVSGPRGGSVEDGTVDCLVYGTDNDVYHVTVTFAQ